MKSTLRAKLKASRQEERLQKCKEDFKNLLGNPPEITDKPAEKIINRQRDFKLEQFTEDELDAVLKKVKTRKTASFNEIPPEVWKTKNFDDIIL